MWVKTVTDFWRKLEDTHFWSEARFISRYGAFKLTPPSSLLVALKCGKICLYKEVLSTNLLLRACSFRQPFADSHHKNSQRSTPPARLCIWEPNSTGLMCEKNALDRVTWSKFHIWLVEIPDWANFSKWWQWLLDYNKCSVRLLSTYNRNQLEFSINDS